MNCVDPTPWVSRRSRFFIGKEAFSLMDCAGRESQAPFNLHPGNYLVVWRFGRTGLTFSSEAQANQNFLENSHV